jgi:hypothetical protein
VSTSKRCSIVTSGGVWLRSNCHISRLRVSKKLSPENFGLVDPAQKMNFFFSLSFDAKIILQSMPDRWCNMNGSLLWYICQNVSPQKVIQLHVLLFLYYRIDFWGKSFFYHNRWKKIPYPIGKTKLRDFRNFSTKNESCSQSVGEVGTNLGFHWVDLQKKLGRFYFFLHCYFLSTVCIFFGKRYCIGAISLLYRDVAKRGIFFFFFFFFRPRVDSNPRPTAKGQKVVRSSNLWANLPALQ